MLFLTLEKFRHDTTAFALLEKKCPHFFSKNIKKTSKKSKNIRCSRFAFPKIQNIPCKKCHVCKLCLFIFQDDLI